MEDKRKFADSKEIWVIKAGFPDTPAKKNWSDYAFAHSLKKYLERLGHYVRIESCDEWLNNDDADVVIVLRGTKRYIPDRTLDGRIYVMWNLSHPSQVTDEEYSSYDLVCISSEPYGEKVRERIHVPVKVLPMCADTEIFYPDSGSCREKEYDWVFVGNSRHMHRKCVTWSVRHGIPLKIWGADWEKFVPDSEGHVVAENMPNDELPDLYRNAKVTVCDHYEDMIENGFINTRIVEAFACGLPVISDYSEVLEKMFGDAILCYRDEEEFAEQTERIVNEYEVIQEKVRSLWPVIREKYSFQACAQQLDRFAAQLRQYRESCKEQVRTLSRDCCFGSQYEDSGIMAVQDRIGRVYRCFYELSLMMASVGEGLQDEERSYGALTDRLYGLRKEYGKLTFMEQQAFKGLTGRARLGFELCVQSGAGAPCEAGAACTEVLYEELEQAKEKLRELEQAKEKLKELQLEKDKLRDRLSKAGEEKAEINRKLQQTYKEKSEINRKLQITYGEKYDRGLQIKSLEKELAAVKRSRTYRLARIIGFPVRMLRKLRKRMKE